MSRYFKYKSRDDLTRDAAERGLDVRLECDLGALFEPARVGGRVVGNRLCIQPMEGCDAEANGAPGELTLRRYERFGAGGAKLIWGEACAVVPEGRANTRQLLSNDQTAAGLRRLFETCVEAHGKAFGETADLLVGLQLTHSGRYSVPRPVRAQANPMLDPRTVMDRETGRRAGAEDPLISDEELEELAGYYVAAARRAADAGFGFVDLKQCHRYLLNELLAGHERPGKYGGSFENRTRFVLDLIGAVKRACPGLIVATRLNVFDSLPYRTGADGLGEPENYSVPVRGCWGTREDDPFEPDLTEPIRLIGLMREAGLELLNVTLGNPYASPHLIRPFEYAPPDGYQTPEHPLVGVDRHFRLTAEIQRAYPDLAVVGSGYSWLQAYMLEAAAANVGGGRATFAGVGRGALSQPDFGRRAMEGLPLDPKRICRTFSYCTALMRSKHNALGQYPTGCPPFDKEVYGPIWKEAQATAPGGGGKV